MSYRLIPLFLICCAFGMAQEPDIEQKLQFERIPFNLEILDHTSTNSQSLFEDHRGYIWFADMEGVFCYDGERTLNFTQKLREDFALDMPKGRYFSVRVDTFNNVWMGGDDGLYVFNLSTHQQTTFRPKEMLNLPFKSVNRTYNLVLHNDLMYNCTRGGFFAIDIHSKEMQFYQITAGLPVWPVSDTKQVKMVYPDENDEVIWGSFTHGYFRYHRSKDTIEIFQAEFDNITADWYGPDMHFIYSGIFKGDTLIAPSYGHGMVYFDTLSKTYQHFLYQTPEQRGSDGRYERVKSILPFDQDRILINTELLGIGVFNLRDHRYTYRRSDNQGYFFKKPEHDMSYDRHGRVWVDKWRSVGPIREPLLPAQHSIQITNVSSRDQKYEYVSLLWEDQLKFDYGQEDFRIEFGLINPLVTDAITYEYMLEGFHLDWELNDTSRLIHIPQVSNGDNTLLIRAKIGEKVIANKKVIFSKIVPFYLSTWFYIAALAILLTSGLFISRWRIQKARKEERKKAAIQRQLLELEAQALKNQMNPHFIFNSLNSIKSLIQESKDQKAVHYLNQFSKFVRKALHHSEKKLIPLDEEIEMCRTYLDIEKLRFDQSFNFEIEIDPESDPGFVKVPPLILQPFLENAIWHGLLHKEGDRHLKIKVVQANQQIKCIIEDNGIGREKAQQLKSTARKSFGTQLIQDRLKVSREMYQKEFDLVILDKKEDGNASGTRVELSIDI